MFKLYLLWNICINLINYSWFCSNIRYYSGIVFLCSFYFAIIITFFASSFTKTLCKNASVFAVIVFVQIIGIKFIFFHLTHCPFEGLLINKPLFVCMSYFPYIKGLASFSIKKNYWVIAMHTTLFEWRTFSIDLFKNCDKNWEENWIREVFLLGLLYLDNRYQFSVSFLILITKLCSIILRNFIRVEIYIPGNFNLIS